MTFPPIFLVSISAPLSAMLAFMFEGFKLDLNVVAAAFIGGGFPVVLWLLNKWWEARQEKKKARKTELEDTLDERQMLFTEYARLRSEEREAAERAMQQMRESYERIINDYAGKDAVSRKRSHALGTGYMQLQFSYQQLIDLLKDSNIIVPARLEPINVSAGLIERLDQIMDIEVPSSTPVLEKGDM